MNETMQSECDITGSILRKSEADLLPGTMKISGIYKIINKVNGKYYIGSSKNMCGTSDSIGRWKEHLQGLKHNRHFNKHLQRAWNKYGESSFIFTIIDRVGVDKLLGVEQKYLDEAIKTQCYNTVFIAKGGGFEGHKHSEETKRRIAKKLLNYFPNMIIWMLLLLFIKTIQVFVNLLLMILFKKV